MLQQGPAEHGNADAHYRRALTVAAELGMRPLVAHCHAGLAKLDARGGKIAEAREHFAVTTAMYREMEMTFWLEKIEKEFPWDAMPPDTGFVGHSA